MFGFGKEGTTNLITKCLEAVGKSLETVPDPTQIHYHLPKSKAHPEVFDASVPFHVRSAVEQKIREGPAILSSAWPPSSSIPSLVFPWS